MLWEDGRGLDTVNTVCCMNWDNGSNGDIHDVVFNAL
jgi:hypothetical protein